MMKLTSEQEAWLDRQLAKNPFIVLDYGQSHSWPQGSKKRGYAAEPGTGPADETCKTCRHIALNFLSKKYYKCRLMRSIWTGGPKTDILVTAPACSKWEDKSTETVKQRVES